MSLFAQRYRPGPQASENDKDFEPIRHKRFYWNLNEISIFVTHQYNEKDSKYNRDHKLGWQIRMPFVEIKLGELLKNLEVTHECDDPYEPSETDETKYYYCRYQVVRLLVKSKCRLPKYIYKYNDEGKRREQEFRIAYDNDLADVKLDNTSAIKPKSNISTDELKKLIKSEVFVELIRDEKFRESLLKRLMGIHIFSKNDLKSQSEGVELLKTKTFQQLVSYQETSMEQLVLDIDKITKLRYK